MTSLRHHFHFGAPTPHARPERTTPPLSSTAQGGGVAPNTPTASTPAGSVGEAGTPAARRGDVPAALFLPDGCEASLSRLHYQLALSKNVRPFRWHEIIDAANRAFEAGDTARACAYLNTGHVLARRGHI